ncbi:MAG: glycosyltransferase family 2 protein [Bacteroidia bacterium]|nr:glycosyltransferase family 2 protein [Bacteroidia bacterium]
MDISVVIPAFEEAESLPELCTWIDTVMIKNNFEYEVWVIDDGSRDNTWQVIEDIHQKNPAVRGVRFLRNYGKSAALNVGFEKVTGKVVITMDADLQDSPDEIPELYQMILAGNDLVSGYKKKRFDPLSKTIPTKLFNWATRIVSGIHNLHDFNCGLKAYRHDVVKSIEVYGEMHRYIPFLAKGAGFSKIQEKVVQHRPRKYGVTKFGGIERFVNGLLDLLTLAFVIRFGRKPMHFFGLLGIASFCIGLIITIFLITQKLYYISQGLIIREIVAQPLFYLSLVAIIVGSQLFLTGFLGELITRNSPERNKYLISKEL